MGSPPDLEISYGGLSTTIGYQCGCSSNHYITVMSRERYRVWNNRRRHGPLLRNNKNTSNLYITVNKFSVVLWFTLTKSQHCWKCFHAIKLSCDPFTIMRRWTGPAWVQVIGLLPVGRQAITWTNDALLSIGSIWTNFSEIRIKYKTSHSKKCICKCRLRNDGHFVQRHMS